VLREAGREADETEDVEGYDVVVDALFGTGLSRAPEGAFAEAIGRMDAARSAGARVLAVDVPSGLSADTGRPLGPCVRADSTVTFAFQKRGLVLHPGPSFAGEVTVADIGIPPEAAARVPVRCELLLEEEALGLLPPRARDAHKGDAGRLLVVAGSPGKSGAAHLALLGALRGGAGLVTLATRAEVLSLALAGIPEAMSAVLPGAGPLGEDAAELGALLAAADGVDAIVVGPGIPRGDGTGALLADFLSRAGRPAVLDADALNALAGAPDALARLGVPLVLTPHPGEMARLCGTTIDAVQADRIGVAAESARAWNATVVLKGARTVVAAPGAPPALIPTGNPGLATGGTGDVLAGLTGALLAGGLAAPAAAKVAAYVHGAAGDLAAARAGERGLVASDLGPAIGAVWARWRR
jgi:NAD(P)H-hydrate epimerase